MDQNITLTLISLLPSIGTLITSIVLVLRIIKKFSDLRSEVKNEGTIANIEATYKKVLGTVNDIYVTTGKQIAEANKRMDELLSKEETVDMLIKLDLAQQNQINALQTDVEVLLNESKNKEVS